MIQNKTVKYYKEPTFSEYIFRHLVIPNFKSLTLYEDKSSLNLLDPVKKMTPFQHYCLKYDFDYFHYQDTYPKTQLFEPL